MTALFKEGDNSLSFFKKDKPNSKKVIVDKFFEDKFESFEDFVIKDEKIDFYLNGEKLISVMTIKSIKMLI